MKPKSYKVLVECVERGIEYGWNRSIKYSDKPTPETVKEEIENAVMNEICEYFDFEEEPIKEK